MGCFEAEAFSGAVIEAVGDESDVLVGDVVESHLLGEELADEPVHVFISATLPGCVRMREVEIGSQFLGDTLVLRELLTVVRRQGVNVGRKRRQHGDHGV